MFYRPFGAHEMCSHGRGRRQACDLLFQTHSTPFGINCPWTVKPFPGPFHWQSGNIGCSEVGRWQSLALYGKSWLSTSCRHNSRCCRVCARLAQLNIPVWYFASSLPNLGSPQAQNPNATLEMTAVSPSHRQATRLKSSKQISLTPGCVRWQIWLAFCLSPQVL